MHVHPRFLLRLFYLRLHYYNLCHNNARESANLDERRSDSPWSEFFRGRRGVKEHVYADICCARAHCAVCIINNGFRARAGGNAVLISNTSSRSRCAEVLMLKYRGGERRFFSAARGGILEISSLRR